MFQIKKSKKFTIILDCDDVLFQCNLLAVLEVNRQKGTHFMLEDIVRWGLLNNELDERLELFADPAFVASQTPYPGAQEFVSELSKVAEIFIATNVPPQCAGARVESIVRYFPEIRPGNILIGARKDLLKADIMLDDAPHNLRESLVDYPVLFRQPWNHSESGMISVGSYDEFLALVEMIRSGENNWADDVTILVGPSGSHKGELARQMEAEGYARVKSYSTKKSSAYHTVSREEFLAMKDAGQFAETAIYMTEFFGVRKEDIQDTIRSGRKALLVMDINGAIAMRKTFPGRTQIIYVQRPKEKCFADILARDIPDSEKVMRLVAYEAETRNQELCDKMICLD